MPAFSQDQIILLLRFITTGSCCIILCITWQYHRRKVRPVVELAGSKFLDRCGCWHRYLQQCLCLPWEDVTGTPPAFLARWSHGHDVWTRELSPMDSWKSEDWRLAGKLLCQDLPGGDRTRAMQKPVSQLEREYTSLQGSFTYIPTPYMQRAMWKLRMQTR